MHQRHHGQPQARRQPMWCGGKSVRGAHHRSTPCWRGELQVHKRDPEESLIGVWHDLQLHQDCSQCATQNNNLPQLRSCLAPLCGATAKLRLALPKVNRPRGAITRHGEPVSSHPATRAAPWPPAAPPGVRRSRSPRRRCNPTPAPPLARRRRRQGSLGVSAGA